MAHECTPPLPGRALMETWFHRNDDNNILLIAGLRCLLGALAGHSNELAGPQPRAAVYLRRQRARCAQWVGRARRQQQIPGPPPWNSHGSPFFFSLHVTRNKCCGSQRTLDRHGLISPDGAPGRHANHTAPPAHRSCPPPSAIRPEVGSQITITPLWTPFTFMQL